MRRTAVPARPPAPAPPTSPPPTWTPAPPTPGPSSWAPVPAAPSGPPPLVVRPSVRAAADLPLRVAGSVLGLLFPFAVAAGFFALARGENVQVWALVGAALLTPEILIALVAPFVPAARLLFTRYVFTEEGLVVRTRILAASEQRVPWEKVTALTHRRTLMDRVLHIERLVVVAYGRRGATVSLVGLRMNSGLRDLVARRMRATATARGLLTMD